METNRDDVSIAIRSAFLKKGVQQKFSLFALIVFSLILLFVETIENKPLNYLRSVVKDSIYRGSVIVSSPYLGFKITVNAIQSHFDLYNEYGELKKENVQLKDNIYDPNFLIFENRQLRKLLDEQVASSDNLVSSRVMIDKRSPYLNSFIINGGSNKKIKNGMAVLNGKNFIGRIVDVNYFSSRVLLVSDLNSKIPVVIEPEGYHAILSGTGKAKPVLEFLPENHTAQSGNKVYTSGKEGIFSPGIPIGEIISTGNKKILVSLFSDLTQVTFVNINIED
tara:strand:- start:209 stop:1045 length:837 start_codon:yes stop_codon:yes gene_type:complete